MVIRMTSMKQTSIEADVIIADFKLPTIGFYLPVPPNAINDCPMRVMLSASLNSF